MRSLIAGGLALLFALDLQAQTFFSETLEVRITNVDVIVTTRDGKPVTGLTRDDFELFENGVKKEITNFLEIRPQVVPQTVNVNVPTAPSSEPPTDVRRRRIVIFVDNSALHPLARNAVLPHLKKFLEENIHPGDEITIATWGNALVTETLMRNDPDLIASAMQRIAKHTTSSAQTRQNDYKTELSELIASYQSLQPPELPPWQSGLYIVRSYAEQVVHEMNAKTGALKSLLASFRGAEGRKIAVLVTQGFSSNPADAAFSYLESIRTDFGGGQNESAIADAREFELRSLIDDIADVANSSGLVLYPIDASGKSTDIDSIDASQHIRTSKVGSVPVAATVAPTLNAIADATGGKALIGSSNFQLAFDTIASDLSTYYSLGYRSEDERQDRMKSIEVRVKGKRYVVRSRRSVVERTVSTEMSDAVAANLFRPMATNDLKIQVAADKATIDAGDTVTVPVTVTIPTGALTLLPDGNDVTGHFSIFAAFVRNDGAVSKVTRQEQQFRFPAASLDRRKEVTVKLAVTADSRTDGLSIGVMDEASHATGFASVKLIR